jgi:UDP-N-acetyl-D-galactosamine dehydrogenase
MGAFIAQRLVKLLARADMKIQGARVGVLGLTFKPDVPDLRNTKVVDILHELAQYGIEPLVHDPLVERDGNAESSVKLSPRSELHDLDALILAVPHRELLALPREELFAPLKQGGLFLDVKSALKPSEVRADLRYWSL